MRSPTDKVSGKNYTAYLKIDGRLGAHRDLALGWLAKTERDLSAANWMLGGKWPNA
jgi:hypothetical protein